MYFTSQSPPMLYITLRMKTEIFRAPQTLYNPPVTPHLTFPFPQNTPDILSILLYHKTSSMLHFRVLIDSIFSFWNKLPSKMYTVCDLISLRLCSNVRILSRLPLPTKFNSSTTSLSTLRSPFGPNLSYTYHHPNSTYIFY